MGKKTGKLIEKMRTDVQALSEAVWALKEHVRVEAAANGSKHARSKKLDRLDAQVNGLDTRGAISSYGSFLTSHRSGGSVKVRWQQENVAAESLIPGDLDLAAARLSAIGHRQRLVILFALLEHPSSAGDLATSLDLGTTGAAYHHLKVLQNAGFVVQEERGTYEIAPVQIGAVLGILSAIASDVSVDVTHLEAANEATTSR